MTSAIELRWADYRAGYARVQGERVHFTPQQLDILFLLMVHRGSYVSRDLMFEFLWPDADGGPLFAKKMIDMAVCYLRKQLPAGALLCRYGFGYALLTEDELRAPVALRHAA